MTAKKSNFLSKIVIDLTSLIFSLFKLIPNLIYLVETEAQLAGKSLISLLILYLIAGTLLTSTWLCAIAMCLVYFVSLHLSWILSLFLVMIINFLLLIITALMVTKTKNNLSFEKTRKLLRHINRH